MARPLRTWWLGRTGCEAARRLQLRLVDQVAGGEGPDTLLLCEHDPVITCGRGTDPSNLGPAAAELPVAEVERGGDVTWHGPGQLVGYPILALQEEERDLHLHLRRTEELLIRTLAEQGCPAGRNPPHTGVWVPAGEPVRKIASIGVAVRRWTTYHGFALNISSDVEEFTRINPCGLDAGLMTTLRREVGEGPGLPEVFESLCGLLGEVFGRDARCERTPAGILTELRT
ncbi:MAG: lipoyl(octanoyl) transferase LipB [bacterium]